MLTQTDRNELRDRYLTRFRNRSIEGKLEVDQTAAAEYQKLDRHIKNLEAELTDARQEMYILNKAFDTASREERVRVAQQQLGVSAEANEVLRDVVARGEECSALTGEGKSWKHRLPHAWGNVAQYVRSGRFQNSWNERNYDPRFVEYTLLGDAFTIMCHDKTKKGEALYERVMKLRDEAWKTWSDAGQPIDRKEVA